MCPPRKEAEMDVGFAGDEFANLIDPEVRH